MENFAVFYSHNIFFNWLTNNKLTFMQMTWGPVGGKPLYVEYQINIGNINNRVTCLMNYVLLTSNSHEVSLYTSQLWIYDDPTKYCAVPISRGHFFHRNHIIHTKIIPDTTHGRDTGFSFLC